MVADVLMYYVNDDAANADRMSIVASEVSEDTKHIRDLAVESMKQDPELVNASTDYLVVGGYLKRTSDYVTDIAEWIIYKRTGKIVELNPGASSFI